MHAVSLGMTAVMENEAEWGEGGRGGNENLSAVHKPLSEPPEAIHDFSQPLTYLQRPNMWLSSTGWWEEEGQLAGAFCCHTTFWLAGMGNVQKWEKMGEVDDLQYTWNT